MIDNVSVGLFAIAASVGLHALGGLLKLYKSPKEQNSDTSIRLIALEEKYDALKEKHHELSERSKSADSGQEEAVRSLAREVGSLSNQVRDLATFVHELVRIRGGV